MSNDFNFDSVVKKSNNLDMDITQKTKTELYKIMKLAIKKGMDFEMSPNLHLVNVRCQKSRVSIDSYYEDSLSDFEHSQTVPFKYMYNFILNIKK